MNWVYEYRNIDHSEDSISKLNEWGNYGWEVCGFESKVRSSSTLLNNSGTTTTSEIIHFTRYLLKKQIA